MAMWKVRTSPARSLCPTEAPGTWQGSAQPLCISLQVREVLSKPSISSQFSSVAQLCLTLCDPMNRSTPGLPVHHQLLEFAQTYIH